MNPANRRSCRALFSCLLVLAATAAAAAPAPGSAVLPIGAVPAEVSPAQVAEHAALQTELLERTRRTRADVAALQRGHDALSDPAARRAMQRRIEAVKRAGQLDLFRIRLRHAQAAGRLTEAKELEAALAAHAKLATPLGPMPSAMPAAPAPPAPSAKQGAGR